MSRIEQIITEIEDYIDSRKLACRRIFDLGTRQKHFLLNLWISQQRQQHLPYNLARHRRRCTGRIQRRG